MWRVGLESRPFTPMARQQLRGRRDASNDAGYGAGYDASYDAGYVAGYVAGYDAGYDTGYDVNDAWVWVSPRLRVSRESRAT